MDSRRQSSPHSTSSPYRFDTAFPILYALFYLAVAFGIHLAFFPIGDTGVEADFYSELAPAAQQLWHGQFSVAHYPYKGPVYSFALVGSYAVVHLLGGDWYRSGVVLNLVAAALSLVLLYRLVLLLFTRTMAVAVTIATSLVYEFFLHAHKASSDLLFFLFAYLAIYLVVAGAWSSRSMLLAGGVSALAFLTRYIGVFLPVATLFAIWLANPLSWYPRLKLSRTLSYLGGFCLVCAPWLLANLVETGRLLNTLNLQNVVQEFYGGGRAAEVPAAGFASLFEVIRHDPIHFLTHYASNLPRRLWLDTEHLVGWGAGVLTMLGLLRFLWIPPDRRQAAYLAYPLCYFLLMGLVFYLPRFSLPIAPAYYTIALALLLQPAAQNKHYFFSTVESWLLTKPGKIVALIATCLVVFIQIPAIIQGEKYYLAKRPLYILPAAKSLAEQAQGSHLRVVMARKAHIAHYAGMGYQPYPAAITSLQNFFAYAWEHQVDAVSVSDIEREYYPDAAFLPHLESSRGAQKIYDEDQVILFKLDRSLPVTTAAVNEIVTQLWKSLEAAEAAGNRQRTFLILRALGAEYKASQEWEKAADCFRRALQLTGDLPSPLNGEEVDVLRINLSLALLHSSRFAEGAEVLGGELANLTQEGDPIHLAMAYSLLARHVKELGRREEAERYLEIARDRYRRLGRGDQVAIIEKVLEDLCRGR